MLNIFMRFTNLHVSRSLPAFSTSSVKLTKNRSGNQDPLSINEALKIENNAVLALPQEAYEECCKQTTISVPKTVDLIPISGVPCEHIKSRRVRIYQPVKNVMQSGTSHLSHWEMEFENRQRWENPLMGWTSSGDPLSNMKVQFPTAEKAIEHCNKNGWTWFLEVPKTEKSFDRKSYAINFSWNRRSRISTK